MKADSFQITEVLQSGGNIHFVLPHFQREYRWGHTNWQTLWRDVLAVYEAMPDEEGSSRSLPEHFLGSLVVVHDGVRGVMATFKLVDGQQRLTTVSLLLCALWRWCEREKPELAEQIRPYLLNANLKSDLRFKLLPTTKRGDRDAYRALLLGETLPEGESAIPKAFEFFRRELQTNLRASASTSALGLDPEKLLNTLLLALQVVFINLNRDENPYRIFESLNAKGEALQPADLVRNYIAMRLASGDQERVFNEMWVPIEDKLSDVRRVGRMFELTAFLRHYEAMRSRRLDPESRIYPAFRDRMNERDDQQFLSELEQLKRFALFYNAFLRPESHPEFRLRQALGRLHKLDISIIYPFLLAVADAHSGGLISTDQFVQACGAVENYLVRRLLVQESTGDMNRLFVRLWPDLAPQVAEDASSFIPALQSALSLSRYPSDNVLRSRVAAPERDFYSQSETRVRTVLILENINLHLSHGSDAHTVLNDAPTIEHILPQTPSHAWEETLGEGASEVSRRCGNSLGNLTLVTGSFNSSLSNAAFAMKRGALAEHGLKLNADYFGGSLAPECWDEAAILARALWLTEKIIEIWPSFPPPPSPDHGVVDGQQWPVLLTINGQEWKVASWRDVMRRAGDFLASNETDFEKLHLAAPGVIRREKFPHAEYVLPSGWHLNINYSGQDMKRHATTLLEAVGITAEHWQVELQSSAQS